MDTFPAAGSTGGGALAFQGGDFGSARSLAFGERALLRTGACAPVFQGGDFGRDRVAPLVVGTYFAHDGDAARRGWTVISAGGDANATLTESSMLDHGTPTLEAGCGRGCKT